MTQQIFTGSGRRAGLNDEWLPAGAWLPQITNGPSADTAELATNKQVYVALGYDTTTVERAICWWRPPKRWDNGTITFEVIWTASSGSGGVAWGLDAVAYSDDDPLDTTYGTQVIVTDTFIVANDVHITPTSTAVTVGGSPADADLIALRMSRETGNASDTIANDVRLLGVVIHWTATIENDA